MPHWEAEKMTDTLELLQNQKEAMEAERAKMDADISDLEAAIKAIQSRRGAESPKSSPAPKKAPVAKPSAKTTRKKPAPAKAAPAKTASATKAAPVKTTAAKTADAKPAEKQTKKPKTKVSLDDGIIKAVKAGQSTPVMILDYVTGKMSIQTTINSVRTRVSRLKREGKLLRGKEGWTLPVT